MTLDKDIYFAQIPEWVLFHAELSPQAVRLYCVLARYADGRCWPGRTLLADQLHVASEKTVDRAMKELVAVCAVTVYPRWDDAGDRTSNGYRVHMIPPDGVGSRITPPRDTDVPTGGVTDVPLTRATSNQTPQPPQAGAPAAAASTNPCTRPGPAPHANCRTCGTTSRQREAAAARDAAARARIAAHADAEATRARQALAAAAVAAPATQAMLGTLRDQLRSA